jgi:hypothetical protein
LRKCTGTHELRGGRWCTTAGISAMAPEKGETMDMRKYSGETFIKLDHVRAGPLQETIAGVKLGKYDKPNLLFESGEALSLNATNNTTLIRAYGPNSADWIGKEIELHAGQVEFQGKPLDAVLVRPISPLLKSSERTKLPSKPPEFGSDPDEMSKTTSAKRRQPRRAAVASTLSTMKSHTEEQSTWLKSSSL